MGKNIFVGRQPILDHKGQIFGYELLYRNSEKNSFPNINPEQATIGLLVNTFLSIGVEKVTENHLSFINFSGKLLTTDFFSTLNPRKVVIEILEDVEITSALITRLRELKNEGFRIALDDFVLEEQYKIHNELFELVSFIKLDFIHSTQSERLEITQFLHRYPHIMLLAEKIETEAQYHDAKSIGCKLFQGYYFAKPEIIKGVKVPANISLHFHIIERMNIETPNIREIADLIMRDVSISYKLLRYINTLAFEVPKKITSIKQAIVIVGLREMKKWMRIVTLHEIGEHTTNGSVKILVSNALNRAKICELLAIRTYKKNSDEYFLLGMFSLVDAILNQTLDEMTSLFPLSELIIETLIGQQTEMTTYLQIAEAIERFDLEVAETLIKQIGISKEELSKITIEAQRWSFALD